jgi:demethylmenaquinone methyltransferase/2-methoxy-6-polyprenyl-1,4-benzoquinol methylase
VSDHGPDPHRALEKYRRLAPTYDRRAPGLERLVLQRSRRRAIERLGPIAAKTVIDVGCGTGLTFPLLVEAVGSEGRVIGIELSPDMLAVARQRVLTNGWTNVELVESPVEEASLSEPADAAVFHFTHDILQSRAALENVVSLLRPGGRVAAASARQAPWVPSAIARAVARPYVTTFEGLDRPWRILSELVPELRVESMYRGCVFVASGAIAEAD